MIKNFLATVRSKSYAVLDQVKGSSKHLDDFVSVFSMPIQFGIDEENKAVSRIEELCNKSGTTLRESAKLMHDTLSQYDGNFTVTINGEVIQVAVDYVQGLGPDFFSDAFTLKARTLLSEAGPDVPWEDVIKHNADAIDFVVDQTGKWSYDNVSLLVKDAISSVSINDSIKDALNMAIENYSASNVDPQKYVEVANQFITENYNKLPNRSNDLETVVQMLKDGLKGGLPSVLLTIKQIWNTLRNLRDKGDNTTSFIDNSKYATIDFTVGVLIAITSMSQIIGNILMLVGNLVTKIVGAIVTVVSLLVEKISSFINKVYDKQSLAGIEDYEDYGTYEFPYGVYQKTLPLSYFNDADLVTYLGYDIIKFLNENGSLTLQIPGGSVSILYNISDDTKVDIIIRTSSLCSKSFYDTWTDNQEFWRYVFLRYTHGESGSPYDPDNDGVLHIQVSQTEKESIISSIMSCYLDQLDNPMSYNNSLSPKDMDRLLRKRFWNGLSWILGFSAIMHTITCPWALNQWTEDYYCKFVEDADHNITLKNYSVGYLIMLASNDFFDYNDNLANSVIHVSNWKCLYSKGIVIDTEPNIPVNYIEVIPFLNSLTPPDEQELRSGSSQDWNIFSGFCYDYCRWIIENDYVHNLLPVYHEGTEVDSIAMVQVFQGFGAEFIRIPNYESQSTLRVLVIALSVTALVVGVSAVSAIFIKKHIKTRRQVLAANAEAAWSDITENGATPERIKAYNKAVRKNNRFVSMFGGTKYSRDGFWASDSAESNITTLAENQILYKAITGANLD